MVHRQESIVCEVCDVKYAMTSNRQPESLSPFTVVLRSRKEALCLKWDGLCGAGLLPLELRLR